MPCKATHNCLCTPADPFYSHSFSRAFLPCTSTFFLPQLPGKCLKHSTPSPQRVLHSIICNRVMLQILKYRAESPPPLTPNNHEPRSRSTYGNTLDIFPSLQPLTSFATTDELELDSASMLEREGWIGWCSYFVYTRRGIWWLPLYI